MSGDGRESGGHYNGHYTVQQVNVDAAVSGTQMREAITEQTDASFINGQIYALQRHYPHAYPTVDIAMVKNKNEVLLIKRADTGVWCFPGGFVDPTDASLEFAAKRELFEETNLSCDAGLDYVGSLCIDDWRYRGRDKILTTLFHTQHVFGYPTGNPKEVTEAKFVSFNEAARIIGEVHAPLLQMLFRWLRG